MVNFLNFEIGNITIADIENLLAKFPNFNVSDIIIQVNPNGTEFKTPLAQYVLLNNNEEALDYLINSKAGANVNAQLSYNFTTPLIEAVTHGHLDVAKCLIENEADIHAITTTKEG
ncbi:hypothetical protein KQX54_016155 [Cotesia glomerata]|uniref:Ankyrin repeat domain-containing protein n=1 Tax=Cotesia glomerata TaxID=32391 RepID=A0AAV7IFH6_COTGL|nr:hypothetical protein KQX54_016155 [Cotesia glomerata]